MNCDTPRKSFDILALYKSDYYYYYYYLSLVVDRHSDREPLDEYISKKREMFLVQVSISVNSLPNYIVQRQLSSVVALQLM